jgi:hypothetical protein
MIKLLIKQAYLINKKGFVSCDSSCRLNIFLKYIFQRKYTYDRTHLTVAHLPARSVCTRLICSFGVFSLAQECIAR